MTNFTLREWNLSDSESLARHANNIRIWNNVRDLFPHPYNSTDGVIFISAAIAKPRPAVDLAIDVNGKAVGGIGIVLQHDVERISAEIGYWLGESFWNKGIMTAAVEKMIKYAFTNFPIRKLYAPVFEYNHASMKVLQKAGFEKEAILKKAAIKNSRIVDLHYFSLIKKDSRLFTAECM